MATARPTVAEHNALTGEATGKTFPLPYVFQCPIRSDVVHQVHTNMAKNRRQAHGVAERAGHMTSAQSWGTGRAVARIPRVAGGGTHRSGQGAFGNMCRGGHMFSPKVIWRRWHRRISFGLRRYAVSSAVAATGVPALVMARGHRVLGVNEIPLVVSEESIAAVKKTKNAAEVLKKIGVWSDVERVIASHKVRAGIGKMRNRRHVQRRGPLLVYKTKGTITRAFRNIPGLDFCCVSRLNLLQLAPGNHLGRLVIWTSDAFAELDNIFGTFSSTECAKGKKGFHLPRAKMTNTDLARLMHHESIRKVAPSTKRRKAVHRKKNPLRNFNAMVKLNPHAAAVRRAQIVDELKRSKKYAEPVDKKAKKAPKPVDTKSKTDLRTKKIKARKAYVKKIAKSRKEFVKSLFA